MEIDDDGNEIKIQIKRKPGRPPLSPEDKVGYNPDNPSVPLKRPPRFSQKKGSGGRPRVSTDINSKELGNIFKSLAKVSSSPNPISIAELICNVVTADLMNQIPGDVVIRTQKSIEILNSISEDMIYAGGGVGMEDDLPGSLDGVDIKQIESKHVIDKIKTQLPEQDIQPEQLDNEDNKKDNKEVIIGNEEGEVTKEVGII